MHNHHHNHSHDHDHHGHNHGPMKYGRTFAIGITINVIFIIAEVFYGFKAGSMALLADAGHNASDVLGLFLAWGAIILSNRKPSERYTYGLQSTSILAALANTVLLLVAIGAIILESIKRLSQPDAINGNTIIVVAIIGILVNGLTAYLLAADRKNDLNLKAAYLHFVADAAVSLGVVFTAILIIYTGWLWLDPVASLVISFIIVLGTWGLLKEALNLTLHAVPQSIDRNKVMEFLKSQQGVSEVHDLHIWAMSTTSNALTAHLIIPSGHPGDEFIKNLAHELSHDFNIDHTTIQIEIGSGDCELAPNEVI